MQWPILGSFGALSPPNKAWFHWNFWQRYSLIRHTQCFSNFLAFLQKGDTQKRTVLVHFWALFTTRKSKVLTKTKIFSKNASSGISNSITSRSHKNNRILIKLIQKNHFGGVKNDLNYPLALVQRVNKKILTQTL